MIEYTGVKTPVYSIIHIVSPAVNRDLRGLVLQQNILLPQSLPDALERGLIGAEQCMEVDAAGEGGEGLCGQAAGP